MAKTKLLEIRNYMRYFTMDDAVAGVNPIRLKIGTEDKLFCPPILQYRHKERIKIGDAVSMVWSEWTDVPFAKEGDEPMPEAAD